MTDPPGTNPFFFTHQNQANVKKYTRYMDPMGMVSFFLDLTKMSD